MAEVDTRLNDLFKELHNDEDFIAALDSDNFEDVLQRLEKYKNKYYPYYFSEANWIASDLTKILYDIGYLDLLFKNTKTVGTFDDIFCLDDLFDPWKPFVIPQGVVLIGAKAFQGSNIEKIVLPSTLESIGEKAFMYSDITSIDLPHSVTFIGNKAFACCAGLKHVTLSNSLTIIGSGVFANCKSLENIDLLDSITSIGDYAFSRCLNLKSIVIPKNVTTIGDSAFWECSNLESIIIPNSVTHIGKSVFADCPNLTVKTNNKMIMMYCQEHGVKYEKLV